MASLAGTGRKLIITPALVAKVRELHLEHELSFMAIAERLGIAYASAYKIFHMRLHESHYHQCAVCEVQLVCVCADRRQVGRATGKPRRLLCVTCGEIERGMRELDKQAARQPL